MVVEEKSIKGLLLGCFLITVMSVPAICNGEESTPPLNAEKSQEQSSSKQNSTPGTFSDVTVSDVGKWFQRTANRVGEEITKATSKTASTIKKVVSGSNRAEKHSKEGE